MPRLGVLSKLYINLSDLSINYSLLDLISDCVVNSPWDESDASSRQSRVKLQDVTMMGLEITGKVRVQFAENNQAYLRMRDAYYRDFSIQVLALNGLLNENNVDGFIFQAKVFNWSEDQSLGNTLYKDFSLKPCPYDSVLTQPPRFVKVIGGVLNYYPIGQG